MTYKRKEIVGDCELYLGDCLEVMPGLCKVDGLDLVTDPPYGIGEAAGKNKNRGGLAKAKDYGYSDWDNSTADEAIDFAVNLSDFQIIFGGNYYNLPPTKCWLVWDKQINGDFADCELAWTNLSKAVRKIEWAWNGFIRKGSMSRRVDNSRVHPTEKPVGVMSWCIGHLPNNCSTVLDPFMGSGTTGVSCAKLGRRFIGIEINETYFDIACRRIEEAYKQPDMFGQVEQSEREQLSLIE